MGMGPGGEHAAGTLAEAGLAVAGVESRLVGGECPYWGGVASKMMIPAGNLVTATATTAAVPPLPGLAGTPFWTNHEAIETEQVPASLVVLGGGAVGCELAQVFARFGGRVTVAEGAARLLPQEEPEAGDLVARVFEREGITVRTGRPAAAVAWSATAGFTVTLDGG